MVSALDFKNFSKYRSFGVAMNHHLEHLICIDWGVIVGDGFLNLLWFMVSKFVGT